MSCGKRFKCLVANGLNVLWQTVQISCGKRSSRCHVYISYIFLTNGSPEVGRPGRNECSGKRVKMKWQTACQKDIVWIGKRRTNGAANGSHD